MAPSPFTRIGGAIPWIKQIYNSFASVIAGTENVKTMAVDKNGVPIDINNPFQVDSDSVYPEDVLESLSDIGDFTGGALQDLYVRNDVVLTNTTSDPIKSITIQFERGVLTDAFGISTTSGDFSNLAIYAIFRNGGEILIFDGSTDSTKVNQKIVENVGTVKLDGVRFEFHTTDTVSISDNVIIKGALVSSILRAVRDDQVATNIGATNNNNLRVSVQEYGDTPAVDAFARLRVSDNFTIFDSKQLDDKQPLFWDEELGGSATSIHSSADASTNMTVTANAADYVIRQTKQRFNYQPGKSQLVMMTYHTDHQDGATVRVGIYDGTGVNNLDPNNGIFFETNSGLSWNIAKNGTVTETIAQANWNVDKLDGTGASEITLDPSAPQILAIDYEWLGIGRVRVGFVINGLIYYCHYFNHSNIPAFDSVYMSTPNLPLRYTIETDGTTGGELSHICSTVISEGGTEKTGVLRSVDAGNTFISMPTSGATYAVVGIRLKSAYRDITVIPEFASVVADQKEVPLKWTLQLNPTINGTFTYAELDQSSVQYAQGATANTVSAQGIVFDSGYIPRTDKGASIDRQFQTALKIGQTIAEVGDELVLCVTPLDSDAEVLASLTFRELL